MNPISVRHHDNQGSCVSVRDLLAEEIGVPLGMNYNQHPGIPVEAHLIALTVGLALVGVVTFGTMVGSMLPFLFRRIGFDPASASAPFVATLVDVTGLVIYFTVALVVLHGVIL